MENLYGLMDKLRKDEVDDCKAARTAFNNGAVQKNRRSGIALCSESVLESSSKALDEGRKDEVDDHSMA